MSTITYEVRKTWAVATFLVMVYVGYVSMYVAPTYALRSWGTRTWWRYFRLGPGWPARVEQPRGQDEDARPYLVPVRQLSVHQPALVGSVGRASDLAALQPAFEAPLLLLPPPQGLARHQEGDIGIPWLN